MHLSASTHSNCHMCWQRWAVTLRTVIFSCKAARPLQFHVLKSKVVIYGHCHFLYIYIYQKGICIKNACIQTQTHPSFSLQSHQPATSNTQPDCCYQVYTLTLQALVSINKALISKRSTKSYRRKDHSRRDPAHTPNKTLDTWYWIVA